MDYETKATTRAALRLYAKWFRTIFDLTDDEPIDPIRLLEQLPLTEGFEDVTVDIVEDGALAKTVPAQCQKQGDGYCIQMKETVYLGAYKKKTGGYRMHIMHEIMHVFADKLGFKPVFTRSVTKQTPPYKRLEWVVKALAGEVMMPYEATNGMDVTEMMRRYGVSKAAAEQRLKYK